MKCKIYEVYFDERYPDSSESELVYQFHEKWNKFWFNSY